MSLDIVTEPIFTAPKIMLYGLPGSGKSTLASKLETPFFFDFEGGLNALKVARNRKTYKDLDDFYLDLAEFYRGRKEYGHFKTIVIDSTDWLMRLAVQKVAGIDKHNLKETLVRSNGGYGAGKQILENEVRTHLLPALAAINELGITVCLIAHAEVKHLLDAEGVNEDKIAPKIDANTMNVFVEWCDEVFYLKRSLEGKHSVLVDSDINALAKNRLGITGEFDLDEHDINKILNIKGEE